MSNLQTINKTWPADLPLPWVDYAGVPVNATLVGDLNLARISRRSRFSRGYVSLGVTWRLGLSAMSAFDTFFQTDLINGSSCFVLSLRYPQNSVLTDWVVRFANGYNRTYGDGIWQVEAQLELLSLVALADASPVLGYSLFYVEDPTQSGGYSNFTTADDYLYSVHD